MKLNLSSKLNKKIEIFEQVIAEDDLGGSKSCWNKISEAHVMVEPVFNLSNHQEIFQAMQFVTNNMLLFTMRFNNNITSKMRIKYKQKFYDIIKIVNKHEQNIASLILTKEVIDEI